MIFGAINYCLFGVILMPKTEVAGCEAASNFTPMRAGLKVSLMSAAASLCPKETA
jgi:hypothetical protein